jgi:transcriptional regulator with XRE-family HTH domain
MTSETKTTRTRRPNRKRVAPIDKKNDVATGLRIRTARMAAGLSQTKLALKLGVTFQQLQKYEKGTNRVGTTRIAVIARETNKPVTFFFPDVVDGKHEPSKRDRQVDEFMATREAQQLLDAMIALPKERRLSVLHVARELVNA